MLRDVTDGLFDYVGRSELMLGVQLVPTDRCMAHYIVGDITDGSIHKMESEDENNKGFIDSNDHDDSDTD